MVHGAKNEEISKDGHNIGKANKIVSVQANASSLVVSSRESLPVITAFGQLA